MKNGLAAAIMVVFFLVGCREECRLPPSATPYILRRASCVFLRHNDDRVLGTGVFVSKGEGSHRRIFCLTARHVLTEWDDDGEYGAPYKKPFGWKIAVLDDHGVRHMQIRILPERWFTANLSNDIAWFELTDGEVADWAISAVAVGSTIKEGIAYSETNGLVSGAAVIRLEEFSPTGISPGSDLVMLLPERKTESVDMSVGTGATTNVLATLLDAWPVPVRLRFKRNSQLTELVTSQLVAQAKVTDGDSGAPVFAMGCVGRGEYPLLAGVVTGSKDYCEGRGTPRAASFCPLDETLIFLGSSLAHRLVEFPEYQ